MIHDAYCDGGLMDASPSPKGGSWAFCLVDADGVHLVEDGGLVFPKDIGKRVVSSNVTEFMAMLRLIEALPDDWSGTCWTDSQVTMFRFMRLQKGQALEKDGVPEEWEMRGEAALLRLGTVSFKHLKGHPSEADLDRDHPTDPSLGKGWMISKKKGRADRLYRVSRHQRWCDQYCSELCAAYLQGEGKETG